MKLNEIIKIVDEISNSNINHFEYSSKNFKLVLKKSKPKLVSYHEIHCNDELACSLNEVECENDEKHTEVYSEYVGVVFTKNIKDNKRFVDLDEYVEKGDILCVIKHLNIDIEVKAPISGKVSKVHVNNNQFVEYGQELIDIL